ncbi:hypothetical protein GGI07_002627 [Coemansia sp. Benny D115]|nr:hypothetical protein GGI07_002627 [Coemansia sp. Benny D115]
MPATVKELDFNQIRNVAEHGAPVDNRHLVIVDVRSPGEFSGGSIKNAHNIPLGDLEDALKLPAQDFENRFGFVLPAADSQDAGVAVHCQMGGRAAKAANIFDANGYVNNLYIYRPGWSEYGQKIAQ